jgi:hypothetical protein
MQMTKRVSMSQTWGLNRGPLEKEPLSSHTSWLRAVQGDRTHPGQGSVIRSAPRVPRFKWWPQDSNGQKLPRQRSSDNWMRHAMTWCKHLASNQYNTVRRLQVTGCTDQHHNRVSGHFQRGFKAPKKRSDTLLTPLMPPKLGCHPQHDTKGAGTKICKCSSKINMKSTSAQIILM